MGDMGRDAFFRLLGEWQQQCSNRTRSPRIPRDGHAVVRIKSARWVEILCLGRGAVVYHSPVRDNWMESSSSFAAHQEIHTVFRSFLRLITTGWILS